LEKDEEVALWMEEGDLVARPGKGASRGRTQNAARKGHEVVVGELRGLVPLAPGALTLISLPSPEEGGVARVDRAGLEAILKRRAAPARRGALGTGAQVLGTSLWGKVDFLFAADAAAFNAAERGLGVTLLVTRDRLAEAMQALERRNAATLRRVPIELVEAPEK
jgi:predicted transcriptional regulator